MNCLFSAMKKVKATSKRLRITLIFPARHNHNNISRGRNGQAYSPLAFFFLGLGALLGVSTASSSFSIVGVGSSDFLPARFLFLSGLFSFSTGLGGTMLELAGGTMLSGAVAGVALPLRPPLAFGVLGGGVGSLSGSPSASSS